MPTSSLLNARPEDVLGFWRDAGPSRWFRKDTAFDEQFRNRFLTAHEAAQRGELDAWAGDAHGALALLILLDQFPRNAFRATPRMFESDAKAREIAGQALRAGFDAQVDADLLLDDGQVVGEDVEVIHARDRHLRPPWLRPASAASCRARSLPW